MSDSPIKATPSDDSTIELYDIDIDLEAQEKPTQDNAPKLTLPQKICERLLRGAVGRFLAWLPLLIVSIFDESLESTSIWLAFGVSVFVALAEVYRSTYMPQCPQFYWITWVSGLAYLLMGIVYAAKPYSADLIVPLANTSYFAACLFSLLFRHPFTAQVAKMNVSEEVWNSSAFKRAHTVLTSIWLLIFFMMAGFRWLGLALNLPMNSVGQIMLGIVLPYGSLIIGLVSSKRLGRCLVNKFSPPAEPEMAKPEIDIV